MGPASLSSRLAWLFVGASALVGCSSESRTASWNGQAGSSETGIAASPGNLGSSGLGSGGGVANAAGVVMSSAGGASASNGGAASSLGGSDPSGKGGAINPGCNERPPGAGRTHETPQSVTSDVVVTNTANAGAGSLRDAIASAADGAVITFAISGDAPTITLAGEIEITKSVKVDAGSEPGLTLSGGDKGRIFNIAENQSLTVRGVTFVHGYIENDYGGAIHTFNHASLTLEHCVFDGNISRGGGAVFVRDYSKLTVDDCRFVGNDGATHGDQEVSGGAIGTLQKCDITLRHSEFEKNKGINGGGIYTIFSNLAIEDCTFIGNDSSSGAELGSPTSSIGGYTRGYGGAIYLDGASRPHNPHFYVNWDKDGDAVGGKAVVRRTLVKNNRAAGNGGGAFLLGYDQDQVLVEDSMFVDNQVVLDKKPEANGGGVFFGPTSATVTGSTFARNSADGDGGGVFWAGPAKGDGSQYPLATPLTVKNSTFSGNHAKNGGGLMSEQWYPPLTSISFSTFVDNVAKESGGALFESNWGVTLTACLFANNRATTGNSANKTFTDGGHNLQFPAPAGTEPLVTAQVSSGDPQLGPLAANGGHAWTHALAVGSAALNAAASDGAPTTDERGLPRDEQPDIGAFERQAVEAQAPLCP